VTRRIDDADILRTVRLLESLRDDPLPIALDVTSAVARRVRLMPLPLPRAFAPLVSLTQFGWASAAAVFAVIVGGLGLAAVLGTGVLAAPAALRLAVIRGGSAMVGAISSFARSLLQVVFGLVESAVGGTAGVDNALNLAARGSLVVCAVMVFLTLLVVLHETRTRRIAG